jgi:prepilin-type N-terminal cleavage/methylation domain-containing protein
MLGVLFAKGFRALIPGYNFKFLRNLTIEIKNEQSLNHGKIGFYFMSSHPPVKYLKGFTLAELLIALLIIGEIATFTIPKVLTAQQNNQYNAIAKETISTLAAAYQQESLRSGITSSTSANNLTQYLNYVAVDTSSVVDNVTAASITCTASGLNRCLKLHNGGMFVYHNNEAFSNSSATNGIWFLIDPDGTTSATRGFVFYLLYNGRISSGGQLPSITSSNSTYSTYADPSWFSW